MVPGRPGVREVRPVPGEVVALPVLLGGFVLGPRERGVDGQRHRSGAGRRRGTQHGGRRLPVGREVGLEPPHGVGVDGTGRLPDLGEAVARVGRHHVQRTGRRRTGRHRELAVGVHHPLHRGGRDTDRRAYRCAEDLAAGVGLPGPVQDPGPEPDRPPGVDGLVPGHALAGTGLQVGPHRGGEDLPGQRGELGRPPATAGVGPARPRRGHRTSTPLKLFFPLRSTIHRPPMRCSAPGTSSGSSTRSLLR